MEERLEAEVQVGSDNRPKPNAAVLEAAESTLLPSLETSTLSLDHQALLRRCMDGSEPILEGELKSYHVRKFSPLHVNIAVLRAAGFRGVEIAQITGAAKQVVYTVLTHPYTKKIRAALVPANSARVIDIRTRIDDYAGELLDQVFSLALMSDKLEDVTKVTFGLLDRAGYLPKQQPASSSDHGGTLAIVPESTMSRLMSALEGSRQVREEVMPTWSPRRPPEEALLGKAPVGVSEDADPQPVTEDHKGGPRAVRGQQVASGGGR